jgi:hypothetical protein
MPINITIESVGTPISEVMRKIQAVYDKLMQPDPKRAVIKVAEMWAVNYRSEGRMVGGWPQLAQSTIDDRARQGFSGEHPILIRQGSLYAMSTEFFTKGQAGAARAYSNYGGRSISTNASLSIAGGAAMLGLGGPKVVHQTGNWTPPRRQYWFTDQNIIQAARLGVTEWITDEVISQWNKL